MAWTNVTATLIGGANVTATITTTNLADAQQMVQAMSYRGFWIANTVAGVVTNQFIPGSAILSLTVV